MDHLKAFRKLGIKWRNATELQKEQIAFSISSSKSGTYTVEHLTLQEHLLYLWEKMLSIPLVLLYMLVLVHFIEL